MNRRNSKLNANGSWASVPGTACLFESAETAFVPYKPGLRKLCTDARSGLFQGVARLSERLRGQLGDFGFVPLPADTYHITYADLLCSLDLPDLSKEHRGFVAKLFDQLPDELGEVIASLQPLEPEASIEPIAFGAHGLAIWGGNALVVKLVAVDANSAERLSRLKPVRADWYKRWCTKYGRGYRSSFTPHCSVGYFEDLDVGKRVRQDEQLFAACLDAAREELRCETVRVDRWAVYGFEDMVTFYRRDECR